MRIGVMLAAWALVGAAATAAAGEVAKDIEQLNKLTGGDPFKGALQQLLDKPDQTKKLIAAAVPLAKEKERLSYNGALVLAAAAAELKDYDSAETLYRVCMVQAAKLQSAKKLLESYGGLIDFFFENKKYDQSARLCRELLELKTDDGKPRVVLTAITTRSGETDFIEDDGFDTAKRLRPGVHRLLIQTVSKQGKYDQAIKLVDSLLKVQDHWLDRELKGRVYREAGQFEEAAKVYEDVLTRVTKDEKLETDERFRYILSNVYVDAKKIDRATKLLEELLEQKPNDPGYNNDLGYILADHDLRLDEAEKFVRRALELDEQRRKAQNLPPEEDRPNGAYLDSMGWVLYKKKQYKEARDYLLKAVEDKSAQHIEIYDHLGDVYLALGDRPKAIEAYRKGLEVAGEGRREAERKTQVEQKIEKLKK